MKQIVSLASTFIVIIVFGTFGLSSPAAEQSAPTKIESASDRIGASPDSGSLSLVTAVVNPLKIEPKQPSSKYITKSARGYDLESVHVLARSIIFPGVVKQGEHMLSVELPNAGILCLDAAFYAGRVQGLIWAMDRDTVEEHELYRTIDDATELFQGCLKILLQQAFSDQTTSEVQLKDVKEEVAEQVQIIQGKLRKAQNVKNQRPELSVGGG